MVCHQWLVDGSRAMNHPCRHVHSAVLAYTTPQVTMAVQHVDAILVSCAGQPVCM